MFDDDSPSPERLVEQALQKLEKSMLHLEKLSKTGQKLQRSARVALSGENEKYEERLRDKDAQIRDLEAQLQAKDSEHQKNTRLQLLQLEDMLRRQFRMQFAQIAERSEKEMASLMAEIKAKQQRIEEMERILGAARMAAFPSRSRKIPTV